ncbi:MAG: WG repeat-containing protein [Cyanobacteriota bacterium]
MKKIQTSLFVLLFTLLSCQVNDKNNIPPLKKEIQVNKTDNTIKTEKIKTINNLLVNLKTYSTFEKNGKIGLLDQDNKEIIPPIYQEIQSVENKFIQVKIDDKWLLFEGSGKKISEEKFDFIYFFKNNVKNIFILTNNKKDAIFDENLKKMTDFIYDQIILNYSPKNYLIFKINGKYGAIDFDIKPIISPKYDFLKETGLRNNVFIATLDNKSFLLEANTEEIISNKYRDLYEFSSIFNFLIARNEKDNIFTHGLIDLNGKEILEPKYNSISVLNNEYLIAELGGKETIFDKNLKIVESITYPYPDKEGYFLIKKDGKTGLLNKSGARIAEPKYDHFSFLTDNFISVNIGGTKKTQGSSLVEPIEYIEGGLYGVIDTTGKIIIEPVYEGLFYYETYLSDSYEYSSNYFYTNKNNKQFLFDKTGKKLIESDFNLGKIYKDKYIIISKARRQPYGIIDLKGNVIIEPIYKSIEKIGDLLLAETSYDFFTINIDEKSMLKISSKYSLVKQLNNENLFIVSINNKFGLINMKGEIIIPIEYENLELNKENYINARIGNTSFVFDKSGKELSSVKKEKLYNRLENTNNERIFISELNKKLGVIDDNDKIIIDFKYDYISNSIIYKNFVIFKLGTRTGLLDLSSGKEIIKAKYDDISPIEYNEDLFKIRINDKIGLFDVKRNITLEPKYDEIDYTVFPDKFIFGLNKKYGVIDINGKIILEAKYDEKVVFSDSLIVFSLDKKSIYLDQNLKEIFVSEYSIVSYNYNSYIMVEKDNRYGFLDKKGKVVVPVKYDKVKDIENGYFKVKLDGRWGTVDEKGNENFVDEIYVNDNTYTT